MEVIISERKSHQKWYDNSRQDMCSIIDHYSRLLSFDDPFNRELRQKCFILNTRYNKERRKNKRNYFQLIMNKLDNLEESNPRMFWFHLTILNCLKIFEISLQAPVYTLAMYLMI
jgi:hypothetical protein